MNATVSLRMELRLKVTCVKKEPGFLVDDNVRSVEFKSVGWFL